MRHSFKVMHDVLYTVKERISRPGPWRPLGPCVSQRASEARKEEHMRERSLLIPMERIERSILLIRGQKVMLDKDLALLCGVETRALNQAVRRNIKRFPQISCSP